MVIATSATCTKFFTLSVFIKILELLHFKLNGMDSFYGPY
jgi:hypothetical protein